jgi:hypothetical protein
MRLPGIFVENFELKALALVLAIILWFSVTMGQDGEAGFTVPVEIRNIPPGLTVSTVQPSVVELEVSGPKFLLMMIRKDRLAVMLDLKGAGEGPVTFANVDRNIQLRKELRIVRIYPSKIELGLVKARK